MPRTNENNENWNEVVSHLSGLGLKLGYHFEQARHPDNTAAVKQSLHTLVRSIEDAFEAVGAAAKDEAVREDAKQAGLSLVHALASELSEASDEVKRIFKTDAQTSKKDTQSSKNVQP